jgi:hypothetical protein
LAPGFLVDPEHGLRSFGAIISILPFATDAKAMTTSPAMHYLKATREMRALGCKKKEVAGNELINKLSFRSCWRRQIFALSNSLETLCT